MTDCDRYVIEEGINVGALIANEGAPFQRAVLFAADNAGESYAQGVMVGYVLYLLRGLQLAGPALG